MTIKDLAARWGVSEREARQIVKDGQVPFIALKAFEANINWTFVRFQPEAVASWEESRERRATTAKPQSAASQRIVLRKMRPRS